MKKDYLLFFFCCMLITQGFSTVPPTDTTIEAFINKNIFHAAVKDENMQVLLAKTYEHFDRYDKANCKTIFNEKGAIKNNAAVIFIFNPLNDRLLDETKVRKIVCSSGRDIYGKPCINTNDYLLAKKYVLLVFIGKTVGAEELRIDLKESYFHKSFSELKEIATIVVGAGLVNDYEGRIVYYGRADLRSPCTLSVKVPYQSPLREDSLYNRNLSVNLKSTDQDINMAISPSQFKLKFSDESSVKTKLRLNYTLNDTLKKSLKLELPGYYFYKDDQLLITQDIHERNFFAFSLGASISQLSSKQFSYNNDTVSVRLDSVGRESWKSNLLVGLEFYPFGRDMDQFLPIWKAPFRNFEERIGIMGGIRLSKDPLSAYYYGICLSLSKGLTVTVGYNYSNQYNNQVVYLPNVGSVDNAKEYLKRSYERNIYFGIFLSPLQMARTLGLTKR
jgi:hypothetical protein